MTDTLMHTFNLFKFIQQIALSKFGFNVPTDTLQIIAEMISPLRPANLLTGAKTLSLLSSQNTQASQLTKLPETTHKKNKKPKQPCK